MTNAILTTEACSSSLDPAPPSHPFRLRRVLRLLRTIDDKPEQTDAALELFEAVGGDGGERVFQKFVHHREGQRLLREAPQLVSHMADRTRLAAMPKASLGRAYLDFALQNGFAADGLVEIGRDVEHEDELDPTRRWFWDRFTAMHDLWHVVTGCDTTPSGEGLLLAFTQGQVPQRGYRVILGLIVLRENFNLRSQWSLVQSWRNGRRAKGLVLARWEELLPLPLDEVRRRFAIPVPIS
jgi:ubiquinone biosynthesis protein COQ4